jgi:hypothetical protein
MFAQIWRGSMKVFISFRNIFNRFAFAAGDQGQFPPLPDGKQTARSTNPRKIVCQKLIKIPSKSLTDRKRFVWFFQLFCYAEATETMRGEGVGNP